MALSPKHLSLHENNPLSKCGAYEIIIIIHELHNRGYEQLRLLSGLSPTGGCWRWMIYPKVLMKNHHQFEHNDDMVPFDCIKGSTGIERSDSDLKRVIDAVLERYRDYLELAKGEDKDYIAWFENIVRHAENKDFPIAFGEYFPAEQWMFLLSKEALTYPPFKLTPPILSKPSRPNRKTLRIIDWNIRNNSHSSSIIKELEKHLDTSFIATLQEVTPKAYANFVQYFGEQYNISYSLDYRQPGPYDGNNRQLGIVVLCSKDFNVRSVQVLQRTPFPDRTLDVILEKDRKDIHLVSLHSITGCDYGKAKSAQFLSFAEEMDALSPDIVTFDANEPKIDHYDISQMEFFNNGDCGRGAKSFFEALSKNGLIDAYVSEYDKKQYIKGQPLIVSHIINKKLHRRYDFIFTKSNVFSIGKCAYLLQQSIEASSDHAMIIVDCCIL